MKENRALSKDKQPSPVPKPLLQATLSKDSPYAKRCGHIRNPGHRSRYLRHRRQQCVDLIIATASFQRCRTCDRSRFGNSTAATGQTNDEGATHSAQTTTQNLYDDVWKADIDVIAKKVSRWTERLNSDLVQLLKGIEGRSDVLDIHDY